MTLRAEDVFRAGLISRIYIYIEEISGLRSAL